jgi:hypothetical protein
VKKRKSLKNKIELNIKKDKIDMKITSTNLRKVIRVSLSDSYSSPVEGFASLMQEFDIPTHSRKKLSKTLQTVYTNNGGPVDALFEVEKTLNISNLPEDFFNQADALMKKERLLRTEGKTIQVTRRQINLFLKEAHNESSELILTEEELNEIAPLLVRAAAGLGSAIKGAAEFLAKGATAVGKQIAKNPKFKKVVTDMVSKASQKMPNIKQYIDAAGVDLKNADDNTLTQMFNNPKLKGELDKVLKTAGTQMKKAEECDCPTPEEMKAGKKA